MASAENEIPTEMQDRGKWYGDAADYWKVRDQFCYINISFQSFFFLGNRVQLTNDTMCSVTAMTILRFKLN